MSFILQLSFVFSAKLPNLLSSNYSAINLLFWNRMTVQFIFGHGVVKIECTAFISCEGPSFFLSSMGVMPSGNPAIKVKCVLYEWRRMLSWLLYLSKASIFQTLLYCLSHFSSAVSRLSVSAPSPPRLSHLSAQITLSSLLCQNWQIVSHSNPLNWQWHFLHCGCIFLFQELPVSPLHSLCHLHQLYLPCLLLFSLNVPDCLMSASSVPQVTAVKPSSLPISLAGSSNFLLPFPPNLVSLSLLSTIWTT